MKINYTTEVKSLEEGQVRSNGKGTIVMVGSEVVDGISDPVERNLGLMYLYVQRGQGYGAVRTGTWKTIHMSNSFYENEYPYVLDATLDITNAPGGKVK